MLAEILPNPNHIPEGDKVADRKIKKGRHTETEGNGGMGDVNNRGQSAGLELWVSMSKAGLQAG